MSQNPNKFQELDSLRTAYLNAVSSFTKEDLLGSLKPVFQKYPRLRAVFWKQGPEPIQEAGLPMQFKQGDFCFLVEKSTSTVNEATPTESEIFLKEEEQEDLSENSLSLLSEEEIHELSWKELRSLEQYEDLPLDLEKDLFSVLELFQLDILEYLFGCNQQICVTQNTCTHKTYTVF